MLTLMAQTIDLYQEAADQGLSGTGAVDAANPEIGFGAFISGLLGAIMIVAALMVLVFLLWGAIEWITAGGDSSKVTKAREKIMQSIIGIIVLAATLAIFMVVQSFLGISVISVPGASNNSTRTRLNPETSCAANMGACMDSCPSTHRSIGQMNCSGSSYCCVLNN